MLMYNHAPPDYHCPFCLLLQGISNEHVISVQEDIVYQNDVVTALLNCGQHEDNHGTVLVIPNQHYENIYDLPVRYGTDIHKVVKMLALAMKKNYQCDGISTRQHNEPGGHQDVWHYHVHVGPRYRQDRLYARITEATLMPLEERQKHVAALKRNLQIIMAEIELIDDF